ncbi:hypothetical protein EVAR_102926_1 [Eumeta japonica]|uniref:Endonuclease/exonuclease/phosphatase domain-containing protein n=1 Tax=Eumeta variegata TaxID=151549 RepID=A0A4C2A2K4_EUMVA|nr:hypothetical protein EVAR_102926_1 [Eumeta japonica]
MMSRDLYNSRFDESPRGGVAGASAMTIIFLFVIGSFNYQAVDWGSKQTNAQGKALLEAFSTLDVVLLNSGDTPTYTKGDASFIVDLTFVTANLIRGISYWKVMDSYTASDCNEIPNDRNQETKRDNLTLRNDQEPDEKNYPGQRCEYERKRGMNQSLQCTDGANKSVFCVECLKKKRKIGHVRVGLAHRGFRTNLYPSVQYDPEDIPPLTENELTEACNRVGNNKAPGLDGIPNIVFKTAIKAAPRLFLGVYDICLKEGTFPLKWKQQ